MCEICGKRKADIALFLSEHAPQLGIKSERAQVAWSELNSLAVEITRLPDIPPEQLHALHTDMSKRAATLMHGLSLSELEEIHFASAVLELTGQLHGNEPARVIRERWRAGERDPELQPDVISSIEAAIAQEDLRNNFRKGITDALTQVFEKKTATPGVTVFVPGSGKPVPPS